MCEVFRRCGCGTGRPPAVPAPMQREVAGEMDIKDIEVFIGIDVGKAEHWATALSREGRKVFDKPLPNDEERLRAFYDRLADHGSLLVVVDQPAAIGALAVAVSLFNGLCKPLWKD